MKTNSLLPDVLKSFDYYKNKLPMYLQQSNGFITHFKIWFDLLVGDNNQGLSYNADLLLNLLNIFDATYLEDCSKVITDVQVNGNKFDLLDKLGSLFRVYRNTQISYYYNNIKYNEIVSLNNSEYLTLIRCQIIKNYCEGTFEQINKYYESTGLEMYVQTSIETATANMYLVHETTKELDNISKLFLAGLLRINSMGITYRESLLDISRLLRWDTATNGWDEGEWTI